MVHAISTPSKIATLQQRLAGVHHPLVLLSCERSFNKLTVVNDFTMAQAFSGSWTCQPLKKPRPPEVAICHVRGVIKKVYKDLRWYLSVEDLKRAQGLLKEYTASAELKQQFELFMQEKIGEAPYTALASQWSFTANEAPEFDQLLGLDLSTQLTQRGMANPVRYLNCD